MSTGSILGGTIEVSNLSISTEGDGLDYGYDGKTRGRSRDPYGYDGKKL